ncbi:MAG: transcription antitermination factor NusB [Clostridia bacterium]|jgi:N utilization substance protein B|nr:transcription antitermination factor NusB [Clostridia bacterium]
MAKVKNSRSIAREMAFKLLFEDMFGTSTATSMLGSLFEEEFNWNDVSEENKEYIEWVRQNTKAHLDELDNIISSFAKGWSIDRMNRVDVSILRLAVCEIIYREDINSGVSINEAVELAKKYSSDESPAFINGILGAYVRSL